MRRTSKQKNTAGFTLLETLIAIMVLSIAVAAAFTVTSKALTASFYARNQTIAMFLAAEGIELVRDVRDDNALAGNADWLNSMRTACVNGSCDIDPINETVFLCPTSGCLLKLLSMSTEDPSVLVTVYTSNNAGSTNSIYARKITITETPINDGSGKIEAKVTSSVSWLNGSCATNDRCFTLTDILSNWN